MDSYAINTILPIGKRLIVYYLHEVYYWMVYYLHVWLYSFNNDNRHTYLSFCSWGSSFHFSEICAIRSFEGNFLISTLFNISLENKE